MRIPWRATSEVGLPYLGPVSSRHLLNSGKGEPARATSWWLIGSSFVVFFASARSDGGILLGVGVALRGMAALEVHALRSLRQSPARIPQERAVAAQATEKHRRMTSGFAAFLTNVGIACVVVPLFFLCVRRGLDPKVHAEFLRALLEGAGTGSAPCVGFDAGGRRGKRRE